MDATRAMLRCSREELDLHNCVTETPYDEDKCIRIFESLRECVLQKKVRKCPHEDEKQREEKPTDKKA